MFELVKSDKVSPKNDFKEKKVSPKRDFQLIRNDDPVIGKKLTEEEKLEMGFCGYHRHLEERAKNILKHELLRISKMGMEESDGRFIIIFSSKLRQWSFLKLSLILNEKIF
jgi:hypothetical protein